MCTEIYYFSGTGNSLAIARDIAEKVNGKLISIPSIIDKDIIETKADVIGIVFPVYNQGVPYIIKRFISKIDKLEKRYIFGVCTYGGSPGISLEYFARIIQSNGGKLAAGFAVNMPYNYITPSFVLKDFLKSFVLREITIEKQQEMFIAWKQRLESISELILTRKVDKLETKAKPIEVLLDFLNLRETLQKSVWLKIGGFKGHTALSFQESVKLMDYSFRCDDNCIGCGVCSKVCPVKNIKMFDSRPQWQHHCEQCFACLQWCTKEAIQFSNKTSQGKRYHHPEVLLSDMMIELERAHEI